MVSVGFCWLLLVSVVVSVVVSLFNLEISPSETTPLGGALSAAHARGLTHHSALGNAKYLGEDNVVRDAEPAYATSGSNLHNFK